ncbi:MULTISPECIES: hypothetical protein [unclassified Prochlorococcus]|uniref:hypothetical protein n=1 Tax=unclassified Prochlorococcus TaxID=2627481 RepID=UPI00145C6DDA|nr:MULTISPECIES: hypothetical protein [unclassified Prochlorococcus]NMO84292.1 hypothetical protein [Prochlorococcus sp. P1344]NMP05023.1 hypothetical protein [Prochlorococcus sp. P1361]NMP12492.1 hypothetical protein [Prochlorococcus sp.P1363]
MRFDGGYHFINCLGRWDDLVAKSMGEVIFAEICRDAQHDDLDLCLSRYRPLVQGRYQDLLDALRALSEEKPQALVIHPIAWCSD